MFTKHITLFSYFISVILLVSLEKPVNIAYSLHFSKLVTGNFSIQTKLYIDKEPHHMMRLFLRDRRRLTFPGGCPPSIISAEKLNCCVRDENR